MYKDDSRFRQLAFETMENRFLLDAAACVEPVTSTEDAPEECQVEVSSQRVALETVHAELEAPPTTSQLMEPLATDQLSTANSGSSPVGKTVVEREMDVRRTDEQLTIESELIVDPLADPMQSEQANPEGAAVDLGVAGADPKSPAAASFEKTLAVAPATAGVGRVGIWRLRVSYQELGV